MSDLMSLEDFNRERTEQYRGLNDPSPRPNGITCPDCGAELVDSFPQGTLASNPPQKRVHCTECNFSGLRVA